MPNPKSLMRKPIGFLLAFTLAIPLCPVVEAADTYPSKPVRIIVPFAPGGGPDVVARIITPQLTERLGKQVFVENHGGAGGVLGCEIAAKSAPDGYTLLVVSGSYAVNPSFYKLPFDPLQDLVPVARLASGPVMLVVNATVPAKSVKELIALAKKQPGKVICVTNGAGGSPHLQAELFRMMAGIGLMIVHFKGVGPAMVDMMGGHSHMMFGTLMATIPHIKSGKLKALGVSTEKRSPSLPDVPTIAESGLPGYKTSQWWGIVAPAGTPKAIIDTLNRGLGGVLKSPTVQKAFEAQGAEAELMGPDEFGKYIAAEMAMWGKVVKDGNIKAK